MFSIKNQFLMAAVALMASASAFAAESFKGYVEVADGHEVYVDYEAPKASKPTVVLVNGLVYDMKRWEPYMEQLQSSGAGILRYYFRGQMRTLKREVRKGTPEFFKDGLSYQELAGELKQVLAALQI